MRKCVICGARVRNMNPKCVTCDPVCTKAKHAWRTRVQQIKYEIDIEDQAEMNTRSAATSGWRINATIKASTGSITTIN
jgi:hypothetical protein